jgi:hypothetical protein
MIENAAPQISRHAVHSTIPEPSLIHHEAAATGPSPPGINCPVISNSDPSLIAAKIHYHADVISI